MVEKVLEETLKKVVKTKKIIYEELEKFELTKGELEKILNYLDEKGVECVVEEQIDDIDVCDDALKTYIKEIRDNEVLTKEEEQELFKAYNNGDMAAKTKIIESNLKLVVSIARGFKNKLEKTNLTLLDLVQDGNEGLLVAIDKFDVTLGNKFSTYATYWIRQSILRAIANTGMAIRVPSHVQAKLNKMRRFEKVFFLNNRALPKIKDYVKELEMTETEVKELLRCNMEMYSLDTPISEDEDKTLLDTICYENDESISSSIERKTQFELVNEKMKEKLKPREYEVLMMRNGLEGNKAMTLREIAKIYHLSTTRVRDIECKALRKTRGAIKGLPRM